MRVRVFTVSAWIPVSVGDSLYFRISRWKIPTHNLCSISFIWSKWPLSGRHRKIIHVQFQNPIFIPHTFVEFNCVLWLSCFHSSNERRPELIKMVLILSPAFTHCPLNAYLSLSWVSPFRRLLFFACSLKGGADVVSKVMNAEWLFSNLFVMPIDL